MAEPADPDPGWHRLAVDGVSTSYAVAGEGRPVLFLHGWGLGHRTYSRPLATLVERGCRVYAPSLPGFGGSSPLPQSRRSLAGYAQWAEAFIAAMDITEPAFVVGHSFGGGVAVALAHRRPGAVRYLVLINSVGAGQTTRAAGRAGYIGGRPLWSWVIQFARELLPPDQGVLLLAGMWTDITANLMANPLGLLEIGRLAARADLMEELEGLRQSGVPILALRGHSDGVVPLSAFQAMCNAIGTEGRIVKGNHSFLLADPHAFDEVMGNLLVLAEGHERRSRPRSGPPELTAVGEASA